MHLLSRFPIVAATAFLFFFATTAKAQPGFIPNNTGQVYSGASISGEVNASQDSLILRVEVFYDCSVSVSFPDSLLVVSLCGPSTSAIPELSNQEITDICAGSLPSCTGGSSAGERSQIYRGAVAISAFTASSCDPATFLVFPYNRMDAINLNNPAATSDRLRVFMQYYFMEDSLNSTPVFGANGSPFLCGGTSVSWNPMVTEPDGDSLVFSLRQPQTGAATASNIPYNTGYSSTDPFGNGSMTIDSETGILSFNVPDTTGLWQVAVQVDEYDRTTGNLISRSFRDFQFQTDSSCSNPPPTVASSLSNLSNATLTSNYTVTLDTGIAASFDLTFTGGAGETVDVLTTALSVLNGASISTTTSSNVTTLTVNWTPSSSDVGTHIISYAAEDDGCDISGKNAQKVTVIVQEAALPFQITSVVAGQESCPDSNDGSITINTIGGTGPFSFDITGFNTGNFVSQDSGIFTGLAPDFYIVNVGDSGSGFDTTFSVTVQPSFFGFLATPFNQLVNPTCDDACNGDARARPNSFGSTPYSFLWSNGETGIKAFDLCGGTHSVSVTDNSGCTIVDSVTLFEPPSIFVTLDSTDSVTCNGGSDGVAFVSGHGGTVASDSTTTYIIDQTNGEFEPYGIGESFNTSNYQVINLFDESLSGALNIGFNFEFFGNTKSQFRLHGNGFITFQSSVPGANWVQSAIPSTNAQEDWIGIWEDLNPGSGGTVETYLVGTSPNRVRVINYVNVPHFTTGQLFTFQYALYETSNIIQIHTVSAPTVTTTAFDGGIKVMGIENLAGTEAYAVTGRNGTNWSATNDYVTFIPASQNFSYTWSSTGSGSSATNLTAGTYTVTAADGSCSDTISFTIDEPAAITIDTTFTPPTCVGDSDGVINVTGNGGNGGPYSFAWSTGDTTATVSNLPAGTYSVTVTDVEGCTETIAVTLNDPDPVIASINVDAEVSCFGDTDGQLTASGSGGTGTYTYLWNTTATTPTISGLGAGTYSVTVTDGNGCTDTTSATVTEPPLLTISIASAVNVSCVGGNDGSITANAASGGTTPYTYLWSSGGSALTESGLSAGTYTITVTDGNGCTATADTTISEPATGVSISIASATEPTCFGDNDGSVTANAATGGTGPYSYLWSSGGTALNETGLTAGTYTITVTDAGGCTDSADTTIAEPAQLVVDTTSVNDPTCAGSNNGSITVSATGGTPAYSFVWSNGDTTATTSGLSAGTYTVTLTDANGCTDVISATLSNGSSITASIAIDSLIDCNGNTNGQITASGSGGTAPYTFLWNTTATTGTIGSLGAGTYTVTVTDNNGCSDSATTTLTEPSALTATMIDSNDVSCLGGNDGSAEVQAAGGTTPYSYLWSSGGTNDTIANKTAGTYTVTVTDINGCTATAEVTLDEPATGIALTMSSTDVLCFGQSNGTATATPTGGSSPYSYAWSNGGNTQTITGLGAGTYVVTVTDANGCTGVDSATVTAPAFPVIAVTSTDSVSCFGASDGQIQAFLVNGTAPFSYNWSTGDTTQTVTNLTAGTYTVTVTDANGCSDTQTDIIAGPAAINLTMNSIDPTCSGSNDGSAWVEASGGTSPYTYLWSTSATTDSISGLGAGTYVVTVTDDEGCEAIDSVTLTEGTGIQATFTLVNDPNCAGETTGSIAASVTNASTPFNVGYLWNTGSISNLLFSVGAGTYTVTVTDNNTGCQDDTTVTLVNPPVLSVSIIDSLNPTCGNNDGEAEASGTGGTGSLTYAWSSGGNAALETGLGGGTYTVTVTDGNGCEDSTSVTLDAPTPFTATGSELASESCTGNDGQATVTMTGGTTPFTFAWSNGDTTQTITGLAANTYTVTVTDASGCTDTAVAIVADSCTCNWTAAAALISDVACNGDSTGAATVTHAGAAVPVTYAWSNGSTNDTISGVPAGTYIVTVTDNDACVDIDTVVISEPTSLEILGFSNITAPTCDDDCDGEATVNATGGTGTLTYSWSSGGSTATVTGLCGGGHYVTVTDGNGCEATDLIALVERPVIFAEVDSTDSVSCPGNNDGAAFLSAHGGFATSTNTNEYIVDQTEGSFEPYPTGRPWNATNYKTFPLQDDATSDTINIFGGDTFEFFGVGHTHFIMNSQGFITFDLSNPNSGQVNGQFSTTSTIPSSAANTPRDFIAGYWHDLDPSVGNCVLETYLVGDAPNRIRVVNYTEIDHWATGGPPNIISTFQIVLYETSNIIQIHSDSLNSDGGAHVQGIENFAGTSAFATPGRNNTNFSADDDYVAFIPATQNFTYTWSSIGSGPSDTTLTAGNYTVTASDGTCDDTVQFEIFEPANGLSVSMTSEASLCFFSTGQAIANVSNGVGPYTYAWSNSTTNVTTDTTDTISGLSSGPYSVTVTDGNGCEDSNTVVVNDLFAPAVTASSTDASCDNSCDGELFASYTCFTCGAAEWFVFPDTTTVIGTGDTLTGQCPGIYMVRITTGFGCSRFDTIDIDAPAPLVLVMDSTAAACAGSNTGGAEVTVSGGTSPYSYAWSTGGTNDTIANQPSGTYTVTVTDANGCSDTSEVTIDAGAALIATATLINDVTCNGGNDGSAVATQSNGTSPFTYLWSDASTNDTLFNATAGTYSVTITGADGCEDSASVVIDEPDTIGFAFTETPVSCGGAGNDGAISLTASGGTPGYTYSWSTGGTGTSISSLTPGTYCVTVTDAAGCVDSACYVLDPPGTFSVAIVDSADVLCFGDTNGFAVVQVTSSGSGNYTYAWTNGASTDTVNNLAPGVNGVTVTDNVSGCVDSASVNIGTPGVFLVSIDSVDSVNCLGGSDGVACASATGGVAPYTFSWSNGDTTPCATGLTAGTYTVTITDANGCTAIEDTVVSEPAVGLTASTSILAAPLCNGDSATVQASGSGGSGSYSFLWPNGDTTAITSLPAGTYCVTVSDGGACDDTACVIITDPSAVLASATPTSPSCPGGNDGELSASGSGGTPGYTYLWSTGSTNQNITGLAAGTYSLTVTDANGCADSIAVILNDPAGMSAVFTNVNTSSCGTCNGSATASITGGAGGYSYNWLTGGSTAATGTSLCAGQNQVVVTDANGCVDTFSVNIPSLGADTVTATVLQNAQCNGGNEGIAVATYTCSVNPCVVEWFDVTTSTSQGNTDTITGLSAGDYYVQLTNDSGCVSFDTITITEPSPVVAAIDTSNDVSCPGGSDGNATASASGGAGGYSFLWSTGSTSSSISGLTSGTYCVTVTDASGCEDTICVTINEPATGISVTASVLANVLCNGGNTGSVTASATGGTAPYTYTWNGTQVADTLFNLTAGQYIVVASDGSPCTATDTVTVTEPTALSATFNNVQDPSCPGDTNGQATISVSGGTPSYTYLWPNGSTDSVATGLAAGTYCVTVTDGNVCQDTFCVTINNPTGITNTFSGITNSSCTVCDGTATANPSGGNGGPFTFLWNNGQTTATNDSLCAGINSVTITDAAGCTLVTSVPINADSADSVVEIGIDPTCGSCDGLAIAQYTCTVTPCTVEWTDLSTTTVIGTTDTIDSLCAGSYSVELTNGAGCVSSAIVTITEPVAIDPNATVTDASCFGTCDGSIALAPTGGSGTFTYAWSNGDTTATTSGLCAGGYTVTISDGTGCDTVVSFTIDEPTEIVSNETLTNASCGNICDGQINVAPSGGAGGYNYNWNPVPNNGNGTSLADSLCGGFYFLTITDANGCTEVDTFVIFQPQPIVLDSVDVTDATCGDCDGEIQPSFSGGAGGFTYNWSNSETTNDIDSLCFGFYQVTVTDVDGCFETFGFPVSETGGPEINLTSTNATASGACDGTATANIVTSTGTVTYIWTNGDTTQTADSLCAGTYVVTVTDGSGCSTVDTITITEPTALSIDFTVTEISCAGNGCDGEILATVTGGVPPYTYAWSNGDTTAFISGLCSGTYVVTVTDSNGTIIVDSVTLDDPTPFSVTADVTEISCPGECNGIIDLTITGSGAPISILWSTGDTTNVVTGLCSGTYSVAISDTSGCSDTLEFTLTEPVALAIVVDSITNPDCQVSNGSIGVTASGGTGSTYSYLWLDVNGDPLSPVQATQVATNLGAGIYNVEVTDSNGCTDTFNVVLNNANAPTITLDSLNDVSCFGECDGAIFTSITGGTAPYSILWSNGETTEDIDSLCAGTDTITVTDADLCLAFDIYTIEEPEEIVIDSSTVVGVTCGSDCDGSISVSISGGTAPYTYVWSDGSTTSSISDLCAGTYDLTVTDANGCELTSSFTVVGPAPIVITLDSLGDATCTNTGDGFIAVTVTGGTAPYTYQWVHDTTDTIGTQDVLGALAGTYVLTVFDANGCSVSDTFEIEAEFFVEVNAMDDIDVCPFSRNVNLTGTQTGANSTRWLFANGTIAGSGNSIGVNTNQDTTMYVFEGINGVCVDRDTVYVRWTPGPGIDAGPDRFIEPGESVEIGGSPTANDGVDVLWTPAQDISSVSEDNPVVNPLETTVYYVSATDDDGCFGLDSVIVTVEEVVDPVGGFSPNGDGVNDFFIIDRIEDYPNAVVQIYNRWGNLIFESPAGYTTPWDGTYKGKSLPVGSYYYVIDLKDPEVTRLITGPVTILK